MTDPGAHLPPMDELYDVNAEYYDTIIRARVAELDGVLADFATHVDRDGAPVIDVGAGTGRLTTRLAHLVAPCEVIAIEPTRSLRAILASRVADDDQLAAQVTIVPSTLEAAADELPERLGGVIAFGVLPHLGPADRQLLLGVVAERVSPGGRALVEVMPPWTNDPIPPSPVADETVGRHRIECLMQGEPVGADQLRWTMTYRRRGHDGGVLHEARADSVCWVTTPQAFEAEARAAGLDVEWPTADLALLGRPPSR